MGRSKLWLIALLAAIIFSIDVALLLNNTVVTLGKNIPQNDLSTDYVTGLLCSIGLGLSILVFPIPARHKPELLLIWIVKSLVTLSFMLFYEIYYSSLDAYSYFKIPSSASFDWTGFRIGSGTQNIYNLVWLYYKIMPVSYHALKVSFAMVGLVAIYVFYRAAVIFLHKEDIRILYAIAFFPSILFWSSTIGKDPIILLGIGLYVYGVVKWHKFSNLRYIFVSALGLVLTMLIRSWLGPLLLIPTVSLLLGGVRGILPKLTAAVVVVTALILVLGQFQEQFRIDTSQEALQTLDTVSRGWAEGGSKQEIQADFTQVDQALSFIPIGIFTALFRPLPGEVLNPFGLLAGLENLLLLFLLALAVTRTRWKDLKDALVIWAILLVLTWAAVYGFVSYQNLGTAVRFKTQILPVLLGVLLYLGRRRQLVTRYRPAFVNSNNRH
ncbi:hypothetical protein H6F50_26280 [Coleofasciculus sp. FACHB-712]|uniref:hypothetical protein n=1 Tax=Coleofasciculus sp. FACHB-712 TaxID=2692789 RepID=UPI0016831B09|nr:hypothetical protein [Coleofasciculus sp. FACHB-712]MBD1945816.1 hypothetical protein [Coleofasciculus sp. FACHB-712]